MVTNYSQRYDSSGSHNRGKPSSRNASPKDGRRQSDRPLPSSNRSKVAYIQSAKHDRAAQTQVKDPRARYARFRSDATVRVFGDSDAASPKGRHQMSDPPVDGDFSSSDGGGVWGAGQVGYNARDVQGMTVREHRSRQRDMARHKSRVPGRILLIAALLVILGAAAFLVYQSPAFSVRAVNVEGAQRLSAERLTELAAVPESSTLLRLDVKGIQSRVEADPWIESAEVRRSFPSTVILTVTERQMAAVVDVSASRSGEPNLSWLVSRDGIWLGSFETAAVSTTTAEGGFFEAGNADAEGVDAEGTNTEGTDAEGEQDVGGQDAGADDAAGTQGAGLEGDAQSTGGGQVAEQLQDALVPQSGPSILEGVRVSAEEVEQLPHIREVSRSINPEIGKAITDEGVLNALDIVRGFSTEMLALVQSISAPDRVRTTLMLTNNVGVAFGGAEDIVAKEKVILALLAEHEGTLASINVRVADRATYRATQ
jgi:hypothetical protein